MITMLSKGEQYIEDAAGVHVEFLISSADEISNLPTGIGSMALDRPRPGSLAVLPGTNNTGSSYYILTNERTWAAL